VAYPPEPMVSSKFWVEVGSIHQAIFTECSGLALQTEMFEYKEGGLNSYTHKLPVRTSVGNVTVKRGIVENDQIWAWYNDVVAGTIKRLDVVIYAYENKMQAQSSAMITWTLKEALPVKWSGPGFKASESQIAVDSIEFACKGFTRT
jgi:phage tail-like protein